jgi:hypothetical protein
VWCAWYEDEVHSGVPLQKSKEITGGSGREGTHLMQPDDDDEDGHRGPSSSDTLAVLVAAWAISRLLFTPLLMVGVRWLVAFVCRSSTS